MRARSVVQPKASEAHNPRRDWILHLPWALVCCAWLLMEGIVDLADTSQDHCAQEPADLDCDFQSEFGEEQAHALNVPTARVGGRGRSNSARSSSVPSQT